jgi:hypothetical protein
MVSIVVTMVAGAWVLLGRRFGNHEEIVGDKHPPGDAGTKLLNLLMNVPEKGIAGSVSDEHDCVNGNAGKVHHHGGGRVLKGVSTNFKCIKTQNVFTNVVHLIPDAVKDLLRGNQAKGSISLLVGADRGAVISAGMIMNVAHYGSPCGNWAKCAVACMMQSDGNIVFIILLIFEGDGDAVS